MGSESSKFQSRRARDIIVEAEDDGSPARALPGRASVPIKAIKDIRDQFDDESPKVGLRDSTWLLVSAVTA